MITLFAIMCIYIIIIANPENASPPKFAVVIFFMGTLLYLINDLAGLSLVRRIRQNLDISWQVMNRLMVAIFLQFVLQLFLAYGLLKLVKLLYPVRAYLHFFFTKVNILSFYMLIGLCIIFFSSSINIYATIRLMRLARIIQNENKEMFENIGSQK